MIVKIKDVLNDGWIWVDNIKDVSISYNYTPHIYNEETDIFLVLITGKNGKENLKKNISVIKPYDVCLINPEWLMQSENNKNEIVEDLKFDVNENPIKMNSKYMNDDVYSCKTLSICFMDNKEKVYAIPSDSEIFLLNNEGKTIERM